MFSVTPIFINDLQRKKTERSVAGTELVINGHHIRNMLWCLDLGESEGVRHTLIASDGDCSVDTMPLARGVFLLRVKDEEPGRQ